MYADVRRPIAGTHCLAMIHILPFLPGKSAVPPRVTAASFVKLPCDALKHIWNELSKQGTRGTLALSSNLLIVFKRLKNIPLDPLTQYFENHGYSVCAVSEGMPAQSPEAISRALDVLACHNERFDMLCSRAREGRAGK